MSKTTRLLCWNVNGIRACLRKGLADWIKKESPDILCLQETKADPDQLDDGIVNLKGYHAHWHSAMSKKGYSGVVTFSKEKPLHTEKGMGIEKFDREGRMVMTEFKSFCLFNVYFPNGKASSERLNFKLEFYDAFLKHVDKLKKKGKKIIFCGDVNTAHKPIDLARPKENETVSGFLPIEREWIDRVVEHGYLDTLRLIHPRKKDLYSWWSLRSGARARNVGWRIDYIFIQKELKSKLKDAYILSDVQGSDHCPVGADFSF